MYFVYIYSSLFACIPSSIRWYGTYGPKAVYRSSHRVQIHLSVIVIEMYVILMFLLLALFPSASFLDLGPH